MAIISMTDRNVEKKAKAAKPKVKHNIQVKVHRFCKIAMFRIIEAMILSLVVSTLVLIIGGAAVPMLAYDMSSSFNITQGTNIYTAFASWMLPMLFYVLLITAATFCVLKKFVIWLHTKFTAFINKPEVTKEKT